jgi:hypothetical protein
MLALSEVCVQCPKWLFPHVLLLLLLLFPHFLSFPPIFFMGLGEKRSLGSSDALRTHQRGCLFTDFRDFLSFLSSLLRKPTIV